MNLSRNRCGSCGDPEALFVGIMSRCCGWSVTTLSPRVVQYNERTSGRPPKLDPEMRRQMRLDRANGLAAKTIAAKYGMGLTQTRVIVRDVPVIHGMPTPKAVARA